jgi:hypothetical protein
VSEVTDAVAQERELPLPDDRSWQQSNPLSAAPDGPEAIATLCDLRDVQPNSLTLRMRSGTFL